ncbi:MAG: sigma 54-interacting transcriptional regulator [Desulfobacterales bacterium]|nr:MAG: sigma 54-interacting transcriptional regulator [Desulfobacterales bacterium]
MKLHNYGLIEYGSERHNRAFKLLMECNRTIIRTLRERELLNKICNLIVQVGKYRLAWIGFAMQDSDKRVCPVAQAGFEDGYFENVDFTGFNSIYSQGPTGNAVRSGSTRVAKDIPVDPSYEPWRTDASGHGYASSIALPLLNNGQVLGALNIYSEEPYAFDPLEVQLLEILSQNLTCGLSSVRAHLESRITEDALQVSEARYRGIFENTKNGVIVLKAIHGGKNFIVIDINTAAQKIEKLQRELILGKSICKILPAVKEYGLFDVLQRVWATGKPEQFPAALYQDARICGWREHFVYRLPSGEIVSVYSDETARKQAEASIRQSEERYRILSEHVADGVILIQNGKLRYANKAFSSMFDYSDPNQLIDREAAPLFENDYRQPFEEMYTALLSGKLQAKKWQAPCTTAKGRKFWMEGRYNVLQWGGDPAVLVTARDITEAKTREILMEKDAENLRNENLKLRATLKDRYKFGEIVGKSPSMREIYSLILQAAASDAGVIIYGETGTGKELIARTIHEMSDRHEHAYVPVNCGAIPEALFESEFFGHRKGAFTGAFADKPGFFDLAHRGTLFLDEVAELTLNMQAKLLRAIEGGGYTPIGGHKIQQADVRVIAATNKNLAEEVKNGLMREDFFYRIHVIPITVPPLKERKEDIPLLVDHLLKSYAGSAKRKTIPKKIMDALCNYDWSGNVRELQNVLQRFIAVNDLQFKGPSDLDFLGPAGIQKEKDQNLNSAVEGELLDFRGAVQKFEKNLILKALEKNRWHKAKAAAALGLPRRTFFRKLNEFGLI